MSVTTPCEICEVTRAHHRCRRCATLVCPDHYVAELELCTDCAAQVRSPDDERLEPDETGHQ